MRSLLVADNVPWPPLGGALVRLAQIVEAVASVSDVDLFVLHNQSQSKFVIPETIPIVRSKGVQNPRTSSRLRWRLEWAVRRGLPIEVVMPRADRAPRSALREWARPPYDVVWFSTARSYEWLGRPAMGPTIVDLDNLEDEKCRLRAALLRDQMRSSSGRASVRNRLALHQVRLNGSDWRRFQRSVAGQVDKVVIASDLDAARSGLANVVVIPNTYPRPATPAENRPPASRPAFSSKVISDIRQTSTRRSGCRHPLLHSSGRQSPRRKSDSWAVQGRMSRGSINLAWSPWSVRCHQWMMSWLGPRWPLSHSATAAGQG